MTQTSDYAAQYLESQKRAQEARNETRATLLSDLRALGLLLVEIRYDGYGDSGNVEDVSVMPATLVPDTDLKRRLEEFGWAFAYALSPGFENNEGGYGALKWNLEVDKIDVTHNDNYVTSETTEHEGL